MSYIQNATLKTELATNGNEDAGGVPVGIPSILGNGGRDWQGRLPYPNCPWEYIWAPW